MWKNWAICDWLNGLIVELFGWPFNQIQRIWINGQLVICFHSTQTHTINLIQSLILQSTKTNQTYSTNSILFNWFTYGVACLLSALQHWFDWAELTKWKTWRKFGMKFNGADGLWPITNKLFHSINASKHKPIQLKLNCFLVLLCLNEWKIVCWRDEFKDYYNSKLTRKVYRQ